MHLSLSRQRLAAARAHDSRRHHRDARQDLTASDARWDDVPLPDGRGTWRPGARSDHYTLFGPAGELGFPVGFQMQRSVQGQHPGLVPYTQPQPPILHGYDAMQMWGQLLLQGTPLPSGADAPKLLNPPPTAGAPRLVHALPFWSGALRGSTACSKAHGF